MYVANINTEHARSLADVDFRGKAAAGVQHFFVPAHVNSNHYVLFWVFGLQTGEQPRVLFMDSIGSGHRSAKALGGDCSTVMQNIRSQLPPQVKVGIHPPMPAASGSTISALWIVRVVQSAQVLRRRELSKKSAKLRRL